VKSGTVDLDVVVVVDDPFDVVVDGDGDVDDPSLTMTLAFCL
jgi:hypothetical protein